MRCTRCEKELNLDETEEPQRGKSGNIICDDCYYSQYTYICPICEELFHEDFSKEISPEYLIVSEDAGEGTSTAPGIYKITSYPFFSDGIIEVCLIETAITKIADLPKDTPENDIRYVCEDCIKEIKNRKHKAKEDPLKWKQKGSRYDGKLPYPHLQEDITRATGVSAKTRVTLETNLMKRSGETMKEKR